MSNYCGRKPRCGLTVQHIQPPPLITLPSPPRVSTSYNDYLEFRVDSPAPVLSDSPAAYPRHLSTTAFYFLSYGPKGVNVFT